MIVEHAFTVNAPSERVLAALLDLRTTVACLPGARLEAAVGDTATGSVRVLLGSATTSYRGTLRLLESDLEAGSLRAVLEGRERHGSAGASADVEIRLRESNGLTTASLRGDLEIDGRPADLDEENLRRGLSSLLRRFGRRLEAAMAEAGLDPEVRLEETIAALSRLESQGDQSTTPIAEQVAAPQETRVSREESGVTPPEAAPEPRTTGERSVPGRIRVLTARPVVVGRSPSRREGVADQLEERPWMLPTVLVSGLLAWALLRRRED